VNIAWHDVWIGALITAALFTAGKEISWALSRKERSGVVLRCGRIADCLALMGLLLGANRIFGAEFTKAYANRFGSRVNPAENAVAVSKGRSS
jgi:membrane protein